MASPDPDVDVWGKLVCVVGQLSADAGRTEDQSVECRGEEFIIGRAKDCSLRIVTSKLISSRHCRLRLAAETGEVKVEDLSTNGTLLNGARLTRHQAVPVKTGDRITLIQKKENPELNLVLEFQRCGSG